MDDIHIKNDIHDISRKTTYAKLHESAELTRSFVILLSLSTVICTFGLLMNSSVTIIGGMIISPLMWPLMKLALGISLPRKSYLIHSLTLFSSSAVFAIITSALLTFISPLKGINPEILARTTPTIIDVFIALAAGAIAALAIVNKRISTTLAGVAMATSLMPPLCVIGVSVALSQWHLAGAATLLFLGNIVSITFASLIVFRIVGIEIHRNMQLRRRGTLILATTLVITAIPLGYFLYTYSYESYVYQRTNSILQQTFTRISPDIQVESVQTTVKTVKKSSSKILSVDALILLPQSTTISQEDRNHLIRVLQSEFQRDIDLRLRVQHEVAFRTTDELRSEYLRNQVYETLHVELPRVISGAVLSSFTLYEKDAQNVHAECVIVVDKEEQITSFQIAQLEKLLEEKTGSAIRLSTTMLTRASLVDPSKDVAGMIEEKIFSYLSQIHPSVTVPGIDVSYVDKQYRVVAEISLPENVRVSVRDMEAVLNELEKAHEVSISAELHRTSKTILKM